MGIKMSDDLKKAILWTVIGAMFAGSWLFKTYFEYKTALTQEQTKRVISLDSKCIEMARLGMKCGNGE